MFNYSEYDFQGENHQDRDFRELLWNRNISERMKFQGAKLQNTNFQRVNLHGAQFQGADLRNANLQSTNLHGTNFCGADLAYANLQYADLHESNFKGAKLHGANLKHCRDYTIANWKNTEYDRKTKFPDDFYPLNRGFIQTRRNRKFAITESGEQLIIQTDIDITKALIDIRKSLQKRQGQEKFRQNLIKLYQGRCAITDCDIEGVLEAAHVEPYCISQINELKNGILLRADLHTLFDLNFIIIHPGSKKIEIKESLRNSSYYKFHEKTLPSYVKGIDSPGDDFLNWRYQYYEEYIGQFLR
jgi:hypothetical protein